MKGERRALPRAVRVLAPAKINLRLELLGKRDDGYHELRTWMAALELADVLELVPTSTGTVELELHGRYSSLDVPVDGKNLACRAARGALDALREAGCVSDDAGVRLRLEKNVPSQAGLGGASADAAAAWLGCEKAFGVALDRERSDCLAELGSDCAFFPVAKSTGVALCQGRGEIVRPAPAIAPRWHVAVIAPAVLCSTAKVYGALENTFGRSADGDSLPIDLFGTHAEEARRWLCNDLERVALVASPELVAWRAALDTAGAEHFQLSGSGSSFFGLFDDPGEARRVMESVKREARARGLEERGRWLTRLSGWGLKFLRHT